MPWPFTLTRRPRTWRTRAREHAFDGAAGVEGGNAGVASGGPPVRWPTTPAPREEHLPGPSQPSTKLAHAVPSPATETSMKSSSARQRTGPQPAPRRNGSAGALTDADWNVGLADSASVEIAM